MTNPILAKLTSLHQRDSITKECLLFLALLDECDALVARYEDLDRLKSAKSADILFTRKHELEDAVGIKAMHEKMGIAIRCRYS